MKERIEKALAKVNKCSGNCKDCNNLIMHFGGTEKTTYYAFSCKYTEQIFGAISDTMKDLKPTLIEALNFELK